jgi:hypothetical protein
MTDPLLAAVDRLTSTAHELIIEGQSYRRRQNPQLTPGPPTKIMPTEPNRCGPYPLAIRWSHHPGE